MKIIKDDQWWSVMVDLIIFNCNYYYSKLVNLIFYQCLIILLIIMCNVSIHNCNYNYYRCYYEKIRLLLI